jgi:hypothetical protein
MDNAQVAVAEYCPDWWPADTRLLVRRVLLDPAQVSAGPRSRRRRTLHPDQRALPIPELAAAGAIYAYSFIMTNLDVSTPDKAVAAVLARSLPGPSSRKAPRSRTRRVSRAISTPATRSRAHQDHLPGSSQLNALFAESGQIAPADCCLNFLVASMWRAALPAMVASYAYSSPGRRRPR